MASLNKCSFIGRLGKDPEVRHLDSGASVANFSLAVSESYKDKTTGEKKETTEWVNCVAWRGLADLASKHLHKGDCVYVEGKLKTRTYEQDNKTRYVTEIVLDSMQMLSRGRTNMQTAERPNSAGSTDDLPF